MVVLAAKSELPNGWVTFRRFNEHLSEEMVIDRIEWRCFLQKNLLPNMVIEFHDCDGNSWRMLANKHTQRGRPDPIHEEFVTFSPGW